VRFRENVRFGPFSWLIAHNFQHKGLFCNTPDVLRLLLKTSNEVFIDFWTVGYTFQHFFDPFKCLWN
jgi:hypothetical protein